MLKVSFAAGSTTASIIAHTVPARAPNKVWFKVPTMSSSLSEVVQHRPGFTQLFDGLLLDWSAFLFFLPPCMVRFRDGGIVPHGNLHALAMACGWFRTAPHEGWLPYQSLRL